MNKQIVLYSPVHLESWSYDKCEKDGIGGSETCHIRLAEHFGRANLDVISLAPCERKTLGPAQAQWMPLEHIDEVLAKEEEQIWIVFRDPSFFSKELPTKNSYYFLAQDVGYDWTEEQLAKVNKYICLCQEHRRWTLAKYPSLEGRVYVSSNGIDSTRLRALYAKKLPRTPKRVIYSSSPDRGLELILDNWFRVVERHPDVKLDVYYGFDNMLKISGGDPNHRLTQLYYKIMRLADKYKDTVTLHGRISQTQLYNEMATSSVWFYPSDWPETSCITTMEMQALGVYPVLNKFWAAGENTFHGTLIDGEVPQKNIMTKCILFKELNNILSVDLSKEMEEMRDKLSEDSLDSFDWKNICEQYIRWFNE